MLDVAIDARLSASFLTPFNDDDALDLDGAVELARWLVEQGNDGLVLAGTTGESPTLTHDEQIALVEAVAGAVDCHVIAGAGRRASRKVALAHCTRART